MKESNIEELLAELATSAHNLKEGEMLKGTITKVEYQMSSKKGVTFTFKEDKPAKEAIIIKGNFSSNNEEKELTGEAYPESFQNKKGFTFQKSFVDYFYKSKEDRALAKLNRKSDLIYYYDEEGKVYFYDINKNKYYINESQTACLSMANIYCELKEEADGIYIYERPDINPDYFNYLYITKDRKPLIDDSLPEGFIPFNNSPIIDPEEGPHR